MDSTKKSLEVKRCQALSVLVYSFAVLLTVVQVRISFFVTLRDKDRIPKMFEIDQAMEYWRRYQSTPTVTTYKVEERWNFTAPKITVCRRPNFKSHTSDHVLRLSLSSFTAAFGYSLMDIIQDCGINNKDEECFPKAAISGDDIITANGK